MRWRGPATKTGDVDNHVALPISRIIPPETSHSAELHRITNTCTTQTTLATVLPTIEMLSKITPTALAALKVSKHYIPAHGLTPNSTALNKPLLIYHGAFPPDTTTASAIEAHLSSVDVVSPQWRYTMYSTSHFHSTSHEVLCIICGRARLCFGGEANPGRVEPVVQRGDALVVPAGVAHRLLEDLEGGFEMVGSYPVGFSWDMCYGREGEEDKVKAIEKLEWFKKDPIYGDEGPVLEV